MLSGKDDSNDSYVNSDVNMIKMNTSPIGVDSEFIYGEQKTYRYQSNPLTFESVLTQIIEEDDYVKKFPENIFLGSELNQTSNGISIIVSNIWSGLTTSKKTSLVEHIYNQIDQLGYDQLQFKTENGIIIARKSLVGKGMIIYDKTRST